MTYSLPCLSAEAKAVDRAWTDDLLLTMELLYQLSYNGLGFGEGGELLYQLSYNGLGFGEGGELLYQLSYMGRGGGANWATTAKIKKIKTL